MIHKKDRNITNKNLYGGRRATIMIFLVLTLTLFSINLVSAFEFDNVGKYDGETQTITIRNSLLYIIPLSKIAEIQLTSPLSIALPLGYYNFANITVRGFEDYTNFLNSIDFYDRKISENKFDNENKFERNFDIKIREVEEYSVDDYGTIEYKAGNGSIIKEYQKVGFHLEERIVWRKLTEKDIKQGEVLDLELWIVVENADDVEWIPNFMGVRVNEWAEFSATGGTITMDGAFQIHTFTTNGTFTVTGTGFADVLVVAGGGAGAKQGGGGGAGGYTYFQNFTLTEQAYAVIVGVGGDGIDDRAVQGGNGTVSIFDNLTMIGGGGGAGWGVDLFIGAEGGSGGGGGPRISAFGGPGTAGQGFAGGEGAEAEPTRSGGGGGGASEVGGDHDSPANGGDGLFNSINGTNTTYAGGGGGGNMQIPAGGQLIGGLGGGGIGGSTGGGSCSAGLDETGGGGGGDIANNIGCDGGDGIVIIRFLPTALPPVVTLNNPANNTNLTTNVVNMNCTVSDGINLVNVSLVLDGIVNETNSSGINNSLYNFEKTVSVDEHNWTCRAANNESLSTTADVRFFDINISLGTELVSPLDGVNLTESLVTFLFNSTPINQDLVSTNISIWFSNGTLFFTNSTPLSGSVEVQTEIGINLSEQNYIWTADTTGTVTTNTTINRTFTVHTTPSAVSIIFPTGNIESFAIGDNLNLNWSIVEPGQNLSEHITNCSFTYNSVEIFLNLTQCIEINSTTFLYVNGVNNLSFKVQEEFGFNTTNTTSWTFSFLETGVDFEGNVSETSSQTFEINLTTGISVQSISAILTYNGTNFTSVASCGVGGDCEISNTIDIPLVVGGEFETKEFFWNLAIFNGTDSSSLTTSTRNQNVTRIHLEECGTLVVQALNFTAYDEQTLDRLALYDFEGTFDFWLGSGTIKRTNSTSNINDTQTLICLQPNETMNIDAIINYDETVGASYTDRFYYFDGHEVSNTSQDIFLYLLNSTFSTSFILKVQDDSLLPVTGALIETQRYYPGEDEFRIVQIAKTDDGGQSVGFFETETVDYRFVIKLDGETLLQTEQQKVIPEVSPFTLTFNIGDPLGEPWASQEDIEDLNSSLTWDEGTGIVTYIYIDSSENFTLARLLVIRQSLVNSSNDTIICNETSTLISATLTCNVGSTDGFYVTSAFITRNTTESLDLQFDFQIETLSGVVGLLGLFFGWFLVLIASFMFKFNEIAGIWAVTITIFLINIIGLINFGGVFVTAILAIAIILTWIMEK